MSGILVGGAPVAPPVGIHLHLVKEYYIAFSVIVLGLLVLFFRKGEAGCIFSILIYGGYTVMVGYLLLF